MKNLDSFVLQLAFPSVLFGISVNTVFQQFTSFSIWLGYISGVLFLLIVLYWLISRITMRIIPRRFANLIFLLDKDNNLAVITHPIYGRVQPPGVRLGYHEPPHTGVYRALKKELGLEKNEYQFWPNEDYLKYEKVEIVPPPFQVQVEKGRHKLGVSEHYDFLYICKINENKPILTSKLHPRWMSLDELKRIGLKDEALAPFQNVIDTYERILSRINSS